MEHKRQRRKFNEISPHLSLDFLKRPHPEKQFLDAPVQIAEAMPALPKEYGPCTLCQLPIDREADGSSSVVSREVNGSPPKKQPRFSGRQIATPILILSVGKSGIFDARNGPCIITTASLSCKVKVEDCLTPGALINDAIINFYLKYLYFEQLSDLQRACAYVFNCFFYSRLAGVAQTTPSTNTRSQLTKSNSDSVSSLAPASLARHANVAKWTRRVDLFCKDYIIIPINEASHWFLGLVCYPWMAGMVSYTALYQAEAFDMCQLTERFANVDSLIGQLNVDDQTMCNAPLERLPSDMVVSFNIFDSVVVVAAVIIISIILVPGLPRLHLLLVGHFE
ncbi:Sentrin-specific protease 7 [Fasciola gigantica]|uniref:Sentrin-specific protease 7 n=1 Tax=Fasciola gigantica TaxID=46835 RepID=A0A504YE91_FASGI|nr:Sentrin-specific protease 7 [Fasciola gigantica]